MSKYVAEFIGTFFLVLAVGFATPPFGPIGVGAVLMGVIYSTGHISYAHLNPAVTLGFYLRGRCSRSDVLPYIAAQVVAAGLASAIFLYLNNGPLTTSAYEIGDILIAETLFTFALMWVILNVATAGGTHGNGFYGLAIGVIVTGGAFTVGKLSGAAFNPAVALGGCLMGGLAWSQIWAYLLASIAGAMIATYVFLAFVEGRDDS